MTAGEGVDRTVLDTVDTVDTHPLRGALSTYPPIQAVLPYPSAGHSAKKQKTKTKRLRSK